MGKFTLFLLCTFIPLFHLFSQTAPSVSHDANDLKGSWQINGSISDWEKLAQNSFIPEVGEKDLPGSSGDLQLTNYVYDEHNVYLYFRRKSTSSESYTFTYYFDINANGFIEYGEPAVTATFTDKEISELTMAYSLGNQAVLRHCYNWSTGVPLHELFNSASAPEQYELTNKEAFAAAVSEKGLGVELAIPWSYLKNWSLDSRSLSDREVFGYLLTLGTSGTNSDVWEGTVRVGVFNEEKTISRDIIIGKTVTTLEQGRSYRFALNITNESNQAAYINLQDIRITAITAGTGFDETGILVKRYLDNNCDGDVLGEASYTVPYSSGSLSQLPIVYSIPNLATMGKIVEGFGDNVCFVVDITFNVPVSSADIEIVPKLAFSAIAVHNTCIPPVIIDGGKPISPVGFSIVSDFVASPARVPELQEQDVISVSVYPNPSRGNITVALPTVGVKAVNLLDNSGRVVRRFGKTSSKTLYIKDLRSGVYYLQVISEKTATRTWKKVLVQK